MTKNKPRLFTRLKNAIAVLLSIIFKDFLFVNYNLFENKRVILVGPANTASRHFTGSEIDEFDLVVRVNSSLDLVNRLNGQIGKRTDVLYHNLKEYGDRSTGPINLSYLSKQKCQIIICPTPTDEKIIPIIRKMKELSSVKADFPNLESIKLRATPRAEFLRLCKELDGFWPTTGLAAVYSLLQSEASHITITGFTFYTSGYLSGYRQNITREAEIQAWVDQNKVHKTELEMDVFCSIVDQARKIGKIVILDPVLENFFAEFKLRSE